MLTIYVSVYNTQPRFTVQICEEKCGLYTVKDGTMVVRKVSTKIVYHYSTCTFLCLPTIVIKV